MKLRIFYTHKLAITIAMSFAFIFFPLFSSSQSNSLQQWGQNRNQTDLSLDSAQIYLDSSSALINTAPLRAIGLVNRAIEISVISNDAVHEAKGYLLLGDLLKEQLHIPISNANYNKSIQAINRIDVNSTIPDRRNEILYKAYMHLAMNYFSQQNWNEALANGRHALEQEGSGISIVQQGDAKRLCALILSKKGNGTSARSELNTLLSERRSEHNKIEEAKTLFYLGRVNNVDVHVAEQYFIQAKEISMAANETNLTIAINSELAALYRSQDNLDQEVETRNMNIELNQLTNNIGAISQENLEIGNAFLNSNNFEKAEPYLHKSVEQIPLEFNVLRQTQFPLDFNFDYVSPEINLQQKAESFKKLADGYEKKGDFERAANYYKLYANLQDSSLKSKTSDLENAIALSVDLGKNEERIALLERERMLTEKSLLVLESDRNLKDQQVFNRNLIIGALFFSVLILLGSGVIMIRNIRSRRLSDKLLALQSLTGQMNPHFIFNALNSVNEFIAQNDERAANRYLTSFSKLMRQVMDDSRHTFISIQEEIEMLKLYLKLEHDRFDGQFDYSMNVSEELQNSELQIPPMMVQPYVENAIGHGLRYRNGRGMLEISISFEMNVLLISIIDDGIGLEKSRELKTQNQKKQVSLAMKNIDTRVELINEIYKAGIIVEVKPAFKSVDNPGTSVLIRVPQNRRNPN